MYMCIMCIMDIDFDCVSTIFYYIWVLFRQCGGRLGHDRMVVGFTTTYAIGAYHHWCCGFDTHSGRGVQHYVIKVCQWLVTGRWFSPVSSTNKTDRHDITEILLKMALKTIKPNQTDSAVYYCVSLLYLFFINIDNVCRTTRRQIKDYDFCWTVQIINWRHVWGN
jgi:hypothetical protein